MKIIFLIFLSMAMCFAKPMFEIIEDEERIVGGEETDISLHPHLVSIRYRSLTNSDKDFTHSCGGNIYDERIIITAAHCVISRLASNLRVVAGTNYRTGTSGVIVPVAEVIFHENYDPESIDFDAAIIVLAAPLPLNNFTMKPIELADREYPGGTLATVAGWGRLKSGGDSPYRLKSAETPFVDRETCREDYLEVGEVTERMVCAGKRGIGGDSTCQGDSGGALVINKQLVGLVSWAYLCAEPDYPTVFSNVYYFVPWFKETITEAKRRHNIN